MEELIVLYPRNAWANERVVCLWRGRLPSGARMFGTALDGASEIKMGDDSSREIRSFERRT
jgi:hypothetical protein